MARLLTAVLLGAGIAAAIITFLTGDLSRLWLLITAATLLVPLLLIVSLRGVFSALEVTSPAAIAAAREAGRLAPAGVVRLTRTGTEINGVRVYRIELIVEPSDRPRYRTSIAEPLDPLELADVTPGTVISVVRLGEGTPDVVLVDDPPPPLRYRGDAESVPVWETDPDAPVPGRTRPLVPTGRAHRTTRRTVFALAGIGAFIAVAAPFRRDLVLRANDVVTGAHDAHYVLGQGRAREAVETFRAALGDSTVAEVALHGTWVRITAPISPGSDRHDDHWVRGHRVVNRGAAAIQPDRSAQFDLDEVDWDAFPGLFARALEVSGVDASEIDDATLHASARRPDGEAPKLSLHASTDYESLSVEADADGTIREAG